MARAQRGTARPRKGRHEGANGSNLGRDKSSRNSPYYSYDQGKCRPGGPPPLPRPWFHRRADRMRGGFARKLASDRGKIWVRTVWVRRCAPTAERPASPSVLCHLFRLSFEIGPGPRAPGVVLFGAAPLQITEIPVDQLVPYIRNARTHSVDQVAQIA